MVVKKEGGSNSSFKRRVVAIYTVPTCAAKLSESTVRQHVLEQWIVIKQVQGTRLVPQRALEIKDYLRQSLFLQRIEQIKHGWLRRKSKRPRVTANRLHVKTLLRITFVLTQVLQRHAMQFGQQFNSHDPTKGIIRCYQQHSTFS